MLNTSSGELPVKPSHKDMEPGSGEDGEVNIKEADEFDSFSHDNSKSASNVSQNKLQLGMKKEISTIDY